MSNNWFIIDYCLRPGVLKCSFFITITSPSKADTNCQIYYMTRANIRELLSDVKIERSRCLVQPIEYLWIFCCSFSERWVIPGMRLFSWMMDQILFSGDAVRVNVPLPCPAIRERGKKQLIKCQRHSEIDEIAGNSMWDVFLDCGPVDQ